MICQLHEKSMSFYQPYQHLDLSLANSEGWEQIWEKWESQSLE